MVQSDKKGNETDGRFLRNISPGMSVDVIQKQDQKTGRLTRGVVKDMLTNSTWHPHGIKVRLTDGKVGRVQKIIRDNPDPDSKE